MSAQPILRLGAVKDIARFEQHLQSLHLNIPCERELAYGPESPLRWPLVKGEIKIGNRIAVQLAAIRAQWSEIDLGWRSRRGHS